MKRISCAVWLPVLALLAGAGSVALAGTIQPYWLPNGDITWDSPFHGTDTAVAVAVDHDDNIIVTGSIESIPGNMWFADLATIKYNPAGETLWVRRGVVSPRMPAFPEGIACDEQNNIYIVGTSGLFWSVPWAMTAVKFRPNGDTAWVRRFPGAWFSLGRALAIDAQQNVYFAGTSGFFVNVDSENFMVVKCDSSGNVLWTRYIDGPTHQTDTLAAMCLDPDGNVIVTGTTRDPDLPSRTDWLTAKLSPDGDTQWVRRFDGGEHQDDYPVKVTTDAAGDVYVCGASYHNTTFWDYQVVKYSPAGDSLARCWYNNDLTNGNDYPSAIVVDQGQNIYVTGNSNDTLDDEPSDSVSIATVKFGPAGGLPLWRQKYRSIKSDNISYGTAMALDRYGNIIVAGCTDNTYLALQQVALKYDPRGNLKWDCPYGAAASADAHARALALDSKGNIYIAGDDYVDGDSFSGTDFSLARISGPDAGVARVIAPSETIRVNRAVTPSVMVKNYSPYPLTNVPVYMFIGPTWLNAVIGSLAGNESLQVNFESWSSRDAGNFPIVAYTGLDEDWEHGNDTAHGFVATVLPWVARDTIPLGPKKKYVKDGGALAYDDNLNLIYAVKGNNTSSFYSFGATQTWVERDSVPVSAGRRKVKKGGKLAYGGNNTVYFAKGNRTAEFWAYNPYRGWSAKPDLPNVLKGGTAMAYVPNLGRIYVLPAENTRQLWYYDTGATWHTGLPDMPNGPKNKTCKDGTALAYDGGQYLYAVKGKTSEFYAYDVVNNVWYTKDLWPNSTQTHKKKTAGDGAALAYAGNQLYAFKGNNTDEFWCWSPAADTWTEIDSMLSGVRKKKVKAGGSLVEARGKVYALKGNGTNEFYEYNANFPGSFFDRPGKPGGQGLAAAISRKPGLRVAPNPFRGSSVVTYSLPVPGMVSVRLYDVTGRQEISLFAGRQRTGEYRLSLTNPRLAAGVYFLKLRFDDGAGEQQLTTKVLIER